MVHTAVVVYTHKALCVHHIKDLHDVMTDLALLTSSNDTAHPLCPVSDLLLYVLRACPNSLCKNFQHSWLHT